MKVYLTFSLAYAQWLLVLDSTEKNQLFSIGLTPDQVGPLVSIGVENRTTDAVMRMVPDSLNPFL